MPGCSNDKVICWRILLRVPEGAIVVRIDREIAIIAPPIFRYSYLNSRTREHHGFTLSEIVQRIGRETTGIMEGWIIVRSTRAITNCDIAHMVHRGATHPAPEWIRLIEWGKRALLINRRSGAEIAHFVPA